MRAGTPSSVYHQCLGGLQGWPGDCPPGLRCLCLEGSNCSPFCQLSGLERKTCQVCAWIEAHHKEIGREQHSMENPILGLSARQDKRYPMLFQSLKFIHHKSHREVKGFWPPGKGYLIFHNSKRIYSIFCLVQFNFTSLQSSLKPLTSTFWNRRRVGKHIQNRLWYLSAPRKFSMQHQ